MTRLAAIIRPALRTYRGDITDPDRWSTWRPRVGDVIVCTPSKSGTTWTQSILAMLLHGGPDLPDKVPVISPWVDAELGVPAEEVAAALDAQPGRRVVKTHTPADGFPIWEGVPVIAVYRHPLDVFLSLRKHYANMKITEADDPLVQSVSSAFDWWVNSTFALDDCDKDNLALLARHYRETVMSDRNPKIRPFHYSRMIADGRQAVADLAEAAEIEADEALIDRVSAATSFGAMKAKAEDFAPVGGTGFWHNDSAFFDSGGTDKWAGVLSEDEIARYASRLAEEIPDAADRRWLETGGA